MDCPQPSDTDIYCGRGKGRWASPGNQRFREIVKQSAQTYTEASSKAAKTRVVAEVVKRIKQGGVRFVKAGKPGRWVELTKKEERHKVAHAIRDLISSTDHARARATAGDSAEETSHTDRSTAAYSYANSAAARINAEDDGDSDGAFNDETQSPRRASAAATGITVGTRAGSMISTSFGVPGRKRRSSSTAKTSRSKARKLKDAALQEADPSSSALSMNLLPFANFNYTGGNLSNVNAGDRHLSQRADAMPVLGGLGGGEIPSDGGTANDQVSPRMSSSSSLFPDPILSVPRQDQSMTTAIIAQAPTDPTWTIQQMRYTNPAELRQPTRIYSMADSSFMFQSNAPIQTVPTNTASMSHAGITFGTEAASIAPATGAATSNRPSAFSGILQQQGSTNVLSLGSGAPIVPGMSDFDPNCAQYAYMALRNNQFIQQGPGWPGTSVPSFSASFDSVASGRAGDAGSGTASAEDTNATVGIASSGSHSRNIFADVPDWQSDRLPLPPHAVSNRGSMLFPPRPPTSTGPQVPPRSAPLKAGTPSHVTEGARVPSVAAAATAGSLAIPSFSLATPTVDATADATAAADGVFDVGQATASEEWRAAMRAPPTCSVGNTAMSSSITTLANLEAGYNAGTPRNPSGSGAGSADPSAPNTPMAFSTDLHGSLPQPNRRSQPSHSKVPSAQHPLASAQTRTGTEADEAAGGAFDPESNLFGNFHMVQGAVQDRRGSLEQGTGRDPGIGPADDTARARNKT